MKGQLFTMDLFAAYGIFMIILLLLTAMSIWVASAMLQKEQTDSLMMEAMAAADHLGYSPAYSTRPYELDKAAVDAFFAQNNTAVADALQLSRNYTIQVVQLNGGVVKLQAGTVEYKPDRAIALERRVRYDGQNAKLVVMIWEKR